VSVWVSEWVSHLASRSVRESLSQSVGQLVRQLTKLVSQEKQLRYATAEVPKRLHWRTDSNLSALYSTYSTFPTPLATEVLAIQNFAPAIVRSVKWQPRSRIISVPTG